MTEHEQLKEICDKIGYKKNINSKGIYYTNGLFLLECEGYIKIVDVREIIFTQEFMDRLLNSILDKNAVASNYIKNHFLGNLMKNLNNPVQYLHNLLGLGQ